MGRRLYTWEELMAEVARAMGQERLTPAQMNWLSRQGFQPELGPFASEEVEEAIGIARASLRRYGNEDVKEAVAFLRHRQWWEALAERERQEAQALEQWALLRQTRKSLFGQEEAPVKGDPGPPLTKAVHQFLRAWAPLPCPHLHEEEVPLVDVVIWSLRLPDGRALIGHAPALPGAPAGLRGYLTLAGQRIEARAGSNAWALKLAASFLEGKRGRYSGRLTWFLLTGHLDLSPHAFYPQPFTPHIVLDMPVPAPEGVVTVIARRSERLWALYQMERLASRCATWRQMHDEWQQLGLDRARPFPTAEALRKFCVRHGIRPRFACRPLRR
jgi:hypothetical protein